MRSLLLALTAAACVVMAGGDVEARDHAGPSQGSPSQAATSVSVEVIVLHAKNDGSGIDPNIGKMPALGKPPFSSYNSYKLLDRSTRAIDKGKSVTLKLPTGRDLMVSYKDMIAPKKKDDPKRYVVTASIQKPGGNTFLPLLEVNAKAGEVFFVAGQDYKGGSLVIGIKVNP